MPQKLHTTCYWWQPWLIRVSDVKSLIGLRSGTIRDVWYYRLLLCYQALCFTGFGHFWSLQRVKSTPCRITSHMICGIIALDTVPRMHFSMLMPNSKIYLLWLLLIPLLHVKIVNWVNLMSGNSLPHLSEHQMSLTLFTLIYVKCQPCHILTINGSSPS